jgi:hypothetical protein
VHKDPWKFRTFTDLPSVCAQTPMKNQDLALWSLGAWGGAVRRIPARPAAGLAGEEVRRGLGAPRSLWWPGLVWGGAGEGCTAVPGSCGHRGRNAGEGTARSGQQAAGQALACAWEPVRGVKRPC